MSHTLTGQELGVTTTPNTLQMGLTYSEEDNHSGLMFFPFDILVLSEKEITALKALFGSPIVGIGEPDQVNLDVVPGLGTPCLYLVWNEKVPLLMSILEPLRQLIALWHDRRSL